MHFDLVVIGAHQAKKIQQSIECAKGMVLLVEPHPEHAAFLRKKFLNNKRILVAEQAITHDASKQVDFYILKPEATAVVPWASQIGSLDQCHAEKCNSELLSYVDKITVTASSIKGLYEKYHVSSVHILLLDTEGSDCKIIMSPDFFTLRPREVVFEFKHSDGTWNIGLNLARAIEKMVQSGYSIRSMPRDAENFYCKDTKEEEADIIGQALGPSLMTQAHDLRHQGYTLQPVPRLVKNAAFVLEMDQRQIPGDIVEIGLGKGGGLVFLQLANRACGTEHLRKTYGIDSFDAMPALTEPDIENIKYGHLDPRKWEGVNVSSSKDAVQALASEYEIQDHELIIVEGTVEARLEEMAKSISHVAVLRLDVDWYQATLHSLRILYPKLSDGGVCIIDDYGAFGGCRKAIQDYFSEIDRSMPEITVFDKCMAYFYKEPPSMEGSRSYPKINSGESTSSPYKCIARYNFLSRFIPWHGKVLEIGVFKGDFASFLLKSSPAKLYLCDPWFKYTEYWKWSDSKSSTPMTKDALKNIRMTYRDEIERGQIIPVVDYSMNFLPNCEDNYFDFVYLDAKHTYDSVKAELSLLSKKLKPGGFVAGDDFHSDSRHSFHGVYRAVMELVDDNTYRFIDSSENQFILQKPYMDYRSRVSG
ncbi:MAG: class I SAM-dependent methyltransferase [Opitutales bacterium]|nr:class I SAM-dependent methyltransferase [Opitutales bacterium]MCH8539353.1 class I SAM-dependent methyltransferase [Opitutales bacterium]